MPISRLVAAGLQRRNNADVGAAEDHAGTGRDGKDGGDGGGEPAEVVGAPCAAGRQPRRRVRRGRQRRQFGRGFLQVGRRGGDHGGFRRFSCSRRACKPGVRAVALRVGGLNHIRNSPATDVATPTDGQAQDGRAAGGDDGADARGRS